MCSCTLVFVWENNLFDLYIIEACLKASISVIGRD